MRITADTMLANSAPAPSKTPNHRVATRIRRADEGSCPVYQEVMSTLGAAGTFPGADTRSVGELYLELHRGTLTTQARTKRGNRLLERALREAEYLLACAGLDDYPIEALVKAGVEDVLVVTGGNSAGDFLKLLGNGREFGLRRMNYAYQEGAGGIAEALGRTRLTARQSSMLEVIRQSGETLDQLLGDILDLANVSNYWIEAIDGTVILFALVLARIEIQISEATRGFPAQLRMIAGYFQEQAILLTRQR